MKLEKLEVITKKRMTLAEFIINDKNEEQQREALLNLVDLTEYYKAMGIHSNHSLKPVSRVKYTGGAERRNSFRRNLQSLRLALLDGRSYKLNFPLLQCNFKRVDLIFVLAMVKGRTDIVYHFLNYGFPGDINSPIFGTRLTPSYFQLACALDYEILLMFLEYSPAFHLTWNGLTPQMIASFNCFSLYYKQPWEFLTTTQYLLMNRVRNIYLRKDRDEPIFLLDFMCMNKHIIALKKLLDKHPELANLSRFCYISHSNLNVLRILTGYQTRPNQEYSGVTPLHIAAFENNISILVTFLYIKCNPNVQDWDGDTPLHVAARKKHYAALELLIRCGGRMDIKNKENVSIEEIIKEQGWKRTPPTYFGTEVLPNIMDMDKDRKIFNNLKLVLDHIVHNTAQADKRRSRFTIINLLSFSNKESEVEQKINKLHSITPYIYQKHDPKLCLELFTSLIE
ncbi:Ankyrin-1 [Nosema granulosis]|uniref:Ankyrin-1 n=1 Tax=Nosema granulosis TaxID=83296 RepID=A0A9P6GZB6_9MICR|nr:Ankyrin-1 [Nosema granulosis]